MQESLRQLIQVLLLQSIKLLEPVSFLKHMINSMPSGQQSLAPTTSVAVAVGLDVEVAVVDVVAVAVELQLKPRKMVRKMMTMKQRLMMKKRIMSESFCFENMAEEAKL